MKSLKSLRSPTASQSRVRTMHQCGCFLPHTTPHRTAPHRTTLIGTQPPTHRCASTALCYCGDDRCFSDRSFGCGNSGDNVYCEGVVAGPCPPLAQTRNALPCVLMRVPRIAAEAPPHERPPTMSRMRMALPEHGVPRFPCLRPCLCTGEGEGEGGGPGQPLLNRHQVGGVSRSPDGLFAQQEREPIRGRPAVRGKRTYGGRPRQHVEEQGTWASRTQKHSEAGYGRPVDRGAWTAKTVKRPRQQPAHPQYANYWAPLTRKRHTMPHSAQPQHTNYWAP